MGRTCRICGRQRPNEQFNGKGYGASVCKRCRKRPKAEQQRILATDEVLGFLMNQKNISAKNILRLEKLASIEDADFQTLRVLALEIAQVKPHKRRRWKFLHADLYRRAKNAGLLEDFDDDQIPNVAMVLDDEREYDKLEYGEAKYRTFDESDPGYDQDPVNSEDNHDDIPF